ncbi:hypothetical protein B0H14DRAFT_3539121 [Mycena olivaceomarginata]|nr:hypothetical protein B0H14DRAFT_3539121 [Mycena olivaceomarginata]
MPGPTNRSPFGRSRAWLSKSAVVPKLPRAANERPALSDAKRGMPRSRSEPLSARIPTPTIFAHGVAEKHGMKVAEVRKRMLGLSTYGGRRKPSLYNAKVSRIMAGLNAGCGVKAMVADNPSMLEGFSREEEKEMIKDTLEKRKAKARGTHANHLSAAADAKCMMDPSDGRGFAMFTRSHSHDKTLPGTIQSWGALDFFQEVLKRDPADVAHLFELWAVSHEQGKTAKNKLLGMQQECTSIITTGPPDNLKCHEVRDELQELHLERMLLQSAVGPLQTLLNSLKCGTTWWKVLTSAEKQKLIEQYDEMVKRGDVKVKEKTKGRKERKAKKGAIVEDKYEDEDKEEPRVWKPPVKPKHVPKPPAHHENEDEEDEEEPRAWRPPVKPKCTPKPPARDENEDEEDEEEPRVRKQPVKPKCAPKPPVRDKDDNKGDEEEPPRRNPLSNSNAHPKPPAPPVKVKHPPKPPARNEDKDEEEGDEEEPCPSKSRPCKLPAKLSRTSKRSARNEDEEDESPLHKRNAKSRPAMAKDRLHALVQKGREANDKARRKSSSKSSRSGGGGWHEAEAGRAWGRAMTMARSGSAEDGGGQQREAEAEATLPHRDDCHGLF